MGSVDRQRLPGIMADEETVVSPLVAGRRPNAVGLAPTAPCPKVRHVWYWTDDFDELQPFSEAEQCQINHAFGTTSQTFLLIGNQNYCIDFERMLQINVHTHTSRPVKAIPM
eukprot:TRINITY_DN68202_c9_g3_i1.p3 TRINITY_DN68202_c9_g3~~TRINITY_DN68202_c9_g3_i1.p3  ORF type:complete len:112 (-),score=2.17 TRINITY_DN68202_c9_g3_i1:340-675(-)